MFSYRSDIEYELRRLNDRLAEKDLSITLFLVGGSALILNGIEAYTTYDIDNIGEIQEEIQEILDDLSIDLNDDARDYMKNYEDREFIADDELSFSNVFVEYLSLPYTLITKMQNVDDPQKMEMLAIVYEEDFHIPIEADEIETVIKTQGYECSNEDRQIIEDWVDTYNEDVIF